jgi:hypothetical protein
MKYTFLMAIMASILVLTSFASAIPVCATAETTYVSGLVTDQTNGNAVVDGANVMVTCNSVEKNTTSASDGSYSVEFSAADCGNGDSVIVSATKGSLSGDNDTAVWFTSNSTIGCLQLIVNVACADVPLIPEYGIMLGGLTIVGALVAFFVIRRK